MVRQIYYRGSLRFCNYSCGYCPFSKEKKSRRQLEEDERELFQFVEEIGQKKFAGAIQIVPYGEALIHRYYWRALAKLSRLSQIEAVGAQSNFSFSVEQMLGEFEKAGGEREKLRLWGTFHPDMVSEQDFLGVCHELKEAGVLFCAGAVGVPENVSLLLRIREKLDPTVYFWINKMDGLGRKYSREEIQAFSGLYFAMQRGKCMPVTAAAANQQICMKTRRKHCGTVQKMTAYVTEGNVTAISHTATGMIWRNWRLSVRIRHFGSLSLSVIELARQSRCYAREGN